jgi:hypothetical protein
MIVVIYYLFNVTRKAVMHNCCSTALNNTFNSLVERQIKKRLQVEIKS